MTRQPQQYNIKLFNTATRQKELFQTLEPGQVKMYTCGPTVYHYAHIGNFRTYVFEDLLRRALEYFGYRVTQVMNITDVDDKTIRGALENKQTLNDFTAPFKEAFFEDLDALSIQRADRYPAATDYIKEMIAMIQDLIDKGYAYQSSDGSVYYAITKFPGYGCLSHLKMDELEVGASERVAADEYDKENVSDFVLWKGLDKERDGEIYWESPFGPGRPGWHLECSAMAMKLLGDTLDIHCGGVDNIFPHHENEIAQSEACSGKSFVKMWLHSEHLIVEGKKMSKSLGNFYTLRDLLSQGFSGTEVRYMLLQTHYKTQLNFTFEGLKGVRTALGRINDFIHRVSIQKGASRNEVEPLLRKAESGFEEALADDLNISQALGHLFDLIRDVNKLCDGNCVSAEEADRVLQLLRRFNNVLDVMTFEKEETIPVDLVQALEDRTKARQDKDWAKADALRDFISSKGYVIEDTPSGPALKLKNTAS